MSSWWPRVSLSLAGMTSGNVEYIYYMFNICLEQENFLEERSKKQENLRYLVAQ